LHQQGLVKYCWAYLCHLIHLAHRRVNSEELDQLRVALLGFFAHDSQIGPSGISANAPVM